METNVKEGLARRCELDVAGSDLRSVLEFDEDEGLRKAFKSGNCWSGCATISFPRRNLDVITK
jgi:hypothetical protein